MNHKQGTLNATSQSKGLSILPIALLLLSASPGNAQDLQYTLLPFGNWPTVASSADGQVLAAYDASGLFISTNSGAMWTKANPFLPGVIPYLSCVVMTPDASTLVAVVAVAGNAYLSHDLGLTWKTNSLPGPSVRKIAISDDGTKWFCANTLNNNGYSSTLGAIYVSTDSGASWQQTSAPITYWTLVASSRDGNRIAAVRRDSQVYTSSDRGATWTNTTPASSTNVFSLIVSSSDGNRLVAIGDTIVCVSTNAGADWVTVGAVPLGATQVAASADASSLAVIAAADASGNEIYTSTNSGAVWEARVLKVTNSPYGHSPTGIAVSGDGSRLLAAAGLVFISPLPPPALSVSVLNYPPSQMTWAISWASNQVGFVLESTPSLSPSARWTKVTNNIDPPVTMTNMIYPGGYRHMIVVTNAIGAPSAFYRLHKP